MKFSEQWLREWVNPALSTQELSEQLSMAGLEVDEVVAAAPAFNGVIVGQVASVEPHPDADKLRVCQVNAANGEVLQIVCGAANVAQGLRVPLAIVGAKLSNGMKIKAAKLRGVPSQGMLCSAQELGLAEQAEGLLELPSDAPVGADIRAYLQLNDQIFDIDLTPNRGDCLSVRGVAREVAALNNCSLQNAEFAAVAVTHDEAREVHIEATEACSHYVGRVIRGINPQAATPVWMSERLRRSGIRSIHPVVDVTNYVLMELGQPMHAFDAGRLAGVVHVRFAQVGEKLSALTGEKLELSPADLVIADDNGPVALAGVVGGEPTAVDASSEDIFLESACFTQKVMAGAARRHKLHTDSSHRFERGVDPALQTLAIERATQLIIELCGGEAGPVVETGVGHKQAVAVKLRLSRVRRLLGIDLEEAQIEQALTALNMQLESTGAGEWQVRPPSYRYDIRIEADLIEEIIRIIGYQNLPVRPQQAVLPAAELTETKVAVGRLREALIQRDYHEAVTYCFVDPEQQAKLLPDEEGINLDNPIARQLGQMRTTLWSSLLPVLVHNQQRQQSRVRLFEIGLRFQRGEGDIIQTPTLAGLVTGARQEQQWDAKDATADFYDVKADVETLLALGGLPELAIQFKAEQHPALHPGQSARIYRGDAPIGWLGVLHPRLLSAFDLNTSPVLFELDLHALTAASVPSFVAASEFPAMRRDLALVVEEGITAHELMACIRAGGEALLADVQVFDVYRGEGLPSGCKSVALGLNFQDKSRTLTEDEVEVAVQRLAAKLDKELNATIRG